MLSASLLQAVDGVLDVLVSLRAGILLSEARRYFRKLLLRRRSLVLVSSPASQPVQLIDQRCFQVPSDFCMRALEHVWDS